MHIAELLSDLVLIADLSIVLLNAILLMMLVVLYYILHKTDVTDFTAALEFFYYVSKAVVIFVLAVTSLSFIVHLVRMYLTWT